MAQDRRKRSNGNNRRDDEPRDQSTRQVSEETIRQRAYERYRERGYEDGRDVDDWLEAERELGSERRRE